MHRTSFHRLVFASLVFLAASLAAQAQVVFTFTGTILTSEIDGYSTSDTITVTFTANDSTLPAFPPDGAGYFWQEENTTDAEIFSTVTFSGASGTWTRPISSETAPDSNLWAIGDSLTFSASADIPDDPDARNGLMIGAEPVYYISLQGTINTSLSYSKDYISVFDFFSAHAGNHDFVSFEGYPSEIVLLNPYFTPDDAGTMNGDTMTFNLTSLNISVVPEPASFTLLAGFGGLLAALALRRSKR